MSIKIFVDQGHNPSGHNLGAHVNGLYEQDINYNVGVHLALMMRTDSRFSLRLSRKCPSEVLGYNNASSLEERVNMANSWPADYFLSIHCNANENPVINGTEMYVYGTQGEAYPLAQHLLRSITARAGTRDNHVRIDPTFYVLRQTAMPAVLLELAYLTNPVDWKKLRSEQCQFANGIYEGLLSYFGLQRLPMEAENI